MKFVYAGLIMMLTSSAVLAADADVVARVNDEPVTHAELVEELLIRHGAAVLNDLVRTRAVEQEMKRRAIGVSEGEVDVEFQRQRKVIESDPREKKSFEQKVKDEYNMSLEGYRSIVRRWVLIRKLLFDAETTTDNEVRVWFYENRERYDDPTFYTVQHVFIAYEDPRTKEPRTSVSIERRKRLIREALINGEDFSDVARRWSDDLDTAKNGGKLKRISGKAARVLLEPAFVDVMLRLKKGQATGPVETAQGFHFLRVMNIEEGMKATYDRFRARAKQDYLESRALTKRGLFLRKLMENTKVEKMFVPPVREKRLTD